jgi:hypothetical protein
MGSVIQLIRNRPNNAAASPIATAGSNASAASRNNPGAAASPIGGERTEGAAISPHVAAGNYPVATAGNNHSVAMRSYPSAAARNHEDESCKSLLVLVVVFTATAIAMSVSVVLAGSNTWAEAVPLIIFVAVFALTKIFLANALFYVMIRSDAHSEAVAAAAAVHNKANGLVIRRPRIPPGFNRPKIAGARPRKGATTTSHGRLAILARKPPNPPPRRGA